MAAQGKPLSHAQARMLLAEQLSPGEAEHNLVSAYLVRGPLLVDALRQALADVAARHPVLRTVYTWADDMSPLQVVLPDAPDLEVVPAPDTTIPEDAARLLYADWWQQPFDLETCPPTRARLAWIDDDTHVLCHAVHHIAFDEWSSRVFRRDLDVAYAARSAGRAPAWAPAPAYQDYVTWEHDRLPEWRDRDLPFWHDALRDIAVPTRPAPDTAEGPTAEHTVVLDAATVRGFTEAGGRFGGFPLAVLLRAAADVLADGDDRAANGRLGVGTLFSSRVDDTYRSAVGCFVNPVVVPVPTGAGRYPDRLAEVTRTMLECLRHGQTPFDEVVRALRASVPGAPWYDTLVFLHDGPGADGRSGDVTFERLAVHAPRTSAGLVVEGVRRADGTWLLRSRWRDDVPTDGTALLEDIAAALRGVTRDAS